MAERREYKGAAAPALLSSDITDSATSFTISTNAGWPTGSPGPFYIVIDPGKSNEEKIKIASRSGSTLTVAASGRGVDGTSASAHSVNATVKHVLTANDVDLVNKHAADTTQDDHTQYMHNTLARTVSAAHNFTADYTSSGDPIFSGDPVYSGAPVFNGVPVFSQMPNVPWATIADMSTLDGPASAGTAAGGVPRANHKHALDPFAIRGFAYDIGDYKFSARATLGSDWLECNGQAVNRISYSGLFDAIGTAYGAGNGTTTFNVPDCRDLMISGGASGGVRAIGSKGGVSTIGLGVNNLPPHTHTINHNHNLNDPGHAHGIPRTSNGAFVNGTTDYMTSNINAGQSNTYGNTTGITISAFNGNSGSVGSGDPFSIIPPYVTMRVLIKAR